MKAPEPTHLTLQIKLNPKQAVTILDRYKTIERVHELAVHLLLAPPKYRTDPPWRGVELETRLAAVAWLKNQPQLLGEAWIGAHKKLGDHLNISHRLAANIIQTVVLYGFDDPYLVGTKPMGER